MSRTLALAGLTLGELAQQLGQAMPRDLRRHKGFVGQLLEIALGTTAGNRPAPDFEALGIELKTLPLTAHGLPLETTYLCVAPLSSVGERWERSLLRRKLASILWIPIEGERHIALPQRRIGQGFLWHMNDAEEALLKRDYEELMELIALGRQHDLHARHGQALQLRPKAANSQVRTSAIDENGVPTLANPRGFYLRKDFTTYLLQRYLQA